MASHNSCLNEPSLNLNVRLLVDGVAIKSNAIPVTAAIKNYIDITILAIILLGPMDR